MSKRNRLLHVGVSLGLLVGLAACGGNGSNNDDATPEPTATRIQSTPVATSTRTTIATRTAIATRTPIEGAVVSGLVVVNQSVSGRTDDRLGAPPAAWMTDENNAGFDKALALADWTVVEDERIKGATSDDGQFVIAGLPAGHYTLVVTKTLDGNLLAARIPFTTGDNGSTVVAEVSWGQVRSVSTYLDDGVEVREVRDPYGRWLITRDGRISELGDTGVTLKDQDGDGSFEITPCVETLWQCSAADGCGEGRVCGCVSSCPFCEDCGATACQPAGTSPNAYRCNDDATCAQPGDRCVCVSSCPECDDCKYSACVSNCQSVEITGLTVSGSVELIVGQSGNVYAVVELSNGRMIDVTTLADWASSDAAIATVDAFGLVSTHAIGSTNVRASLGDLNSNDWNLNVTPRPALRSIYVQNVNCYYPLGDPRVNPGQRPPVLDAAPIRDDIWWPACNQVVRIGTTIQFRATGEFGNGAYYEDITDEVTFQLAPSGVGSLTDGLFTAKSEGSATLTASLQGITSAGTEIRVVTKATVTALSIWADQAIPIFDGPVRVAAEGAAAEIVSDPCFECGYTIPILRGDDLHFHATAHYDTGEWQEVTGDVSWSSSNTAVAPIDDDGTMMAISAGTAVIAATFEELTSNLVTAHVVNQATLQSMYVQTEGTDRVIVKGGQVFLRAQGSYDIGIQRDLTADVTWRSSNDAVGTFTTPGVFTGLSAGTVQVWAESGAQRSESLTLEVYETSDVTYCDAANVNRGLWSDDFNRVTLESDCKEYQRPGIVTLRYTVTETQPHGGIFDPCLDLYVYKGSDRIRTLREEGCGEPFLPAAAPDYADAVLKYQLRAFWDLKDETGETVAPGTYTVFGRFYLYYDPVVSIDVTVE